MKTTYTLEALLTALRAWSDGPKHVIVNSVTHYEAVKIAEEAGANVLISHMELTVDYMAKCGHKVGTFFIVGDRKDSGVVESIVASRPDLDIRFASL